MVGYHITSILSKSFDGDRNQKCPWTFWNPCPQVFSAYHKYSLVPASGRSMLHLLLGQTVKYHLFESSRLITNLQFGFRLISRASSVTFKCRWWAVGGWFRWYVDMWTHESNWRNLIVEFLGNYKSRWTMHNCCANNKHTRKDFNASLVAADCWLYCTQQPGFFVWCKSLGVVWDSWVCVGSSLGVCKGVALVKRRVSAFAMYRIGLAGPRHCSVMRCGTI